MTMATIDEETAASCLYALPRGGKTIEGRSTRLAEIVASAFGNIRSASRIVEIGETHIVAEGVCHDLENNVAVSCQVRRRITTKAGKRFDDDMITVTCNAASSIAIRNAIFKIVPAALTQGVYEAAKKMATGGALPLETRRAKALARFALMGVHEDRILAKLEKSSIADINQDDLAILVGIFNSIKSNEAAVDNVFPQGSPASDIQGRVAKAKKAAKPAPDTKPVDPPQSPAETTAAIPPDVFDQLGTMDRSLANYVWGQSLAAGWNADDFLNHHMELAEKGQSAEEALATMTAKFNKIGQ